MISVVKNGIKYGIKNGIFVYPSVVLQYDFYKNEWYFAPLTNEGNISVFTKFYLKDYKKSWWLREDKSE